MLKVYTQKNTLSNRKKPYVFKSQNAFTVDEEDIIKAIAESHTTITEADARAVLSVLENVFWEKINLGCVVKLFMGSFRAGASGSADSEDEIFKPKKVHYRNAPVRDHAISLLFNTNKKKEKNLCTTVKTERVRHGGLCNPYITQILNTFDNSIEFTQKDVATIDGRFIKIDILDPEQGVFVSGNGVNVRINKYLHNTKSKIEFFIPDELSDGIYLVMVKTNRKGVLHSSNSHQIVVHTATSSPK